MTTQRWTESKSIVELWPFVPLIGGRKFHLLACAHARRVWHLLADDGPKRAIGVAELYADGSANVADLDSAKKEVDSLIRGFQHGLVDDYESLSRWEAIWTSYTTVSIPECPRAVAGGAAALADMALRSVKIAAGELAPYHIPDGDAVGANLIREIVGDPFADHPPVFLSQWRTPAITALAREVYNNRPSNTGAMSQEGLLELANELEEAGCHTQFLDHFRSPGPHVRGCWVLDTVLGY